jgi:arylsulfatase A-like enzyme
VYDQALIFILADHGHPWGTFGVRLPSALAEKSSGSNGIPKGVLESGIPLLLVKRPGDRGELRINDAPASQIDVSATIFDHLGLGQIGMGEPLFQITTDRLRERHFFYYSWEHSNWMNRYLPALVEYHVMGHSWLPSSWRATGKVLRPDK